MSYFAEDDPIKRKKNIYISYNLFFFSLEITSPLGQSLLLSLMRKCLPQIYTESFIFQIYRFRIRISCFILQGGNADAFL